MRDFNSTGILIGKPYQKISEVSTVQHYPIGTIWEDHGRRFRYCRAVEAVTGTHHGLQNISLHGGDTGGGVYGLMGTIAFASYKGDGSVFVDNVSTGDANTIFPVDWFYNGTINFYVPHADFTDLLSMRISGSDLATTTGVRIYLDEPLPCDIAATVFFEAHPSPYLNVGTGHAQAAYSFVCVNHIELSANDYFWGQTRGPCYVQRNVGVDTSARMKVFIAGIMEDAASNDIRQTIGYALTPAVSDGMVMLMLE
jgi:hypothetical protein